MNHTQPANPSISLSSLVFIALLLLLGATVAISQVNLGQWSLLAGMTIASCKAALILLFFMRISSSTALLRLVAGAGYFWLIVWFVLVMCDYFNRTSAG